MPDKILAAIYNEQGFSNDVAQGWGHGPQSPASRLLRTKKTVAAAQALALATLCDLRSAQGRFRTAAEEAQSAA